MIQTDNQRRDNTIYYFFRSPIYIIILYIIISNKIFYVLKDKPREYVKALWALLNDLMYIPNASDGESLHIPNIRYVA